MLVVYCLNEVRGEIVVTDDSGLVGALTVHRQGAKCAALSTEFPVDVTEAENALRKPIISDYSFCVGLRLCD